MARSTESAETRSIGYFERWHRHLKEAVGPIGEELARKRDEEGQPYVAVCGYPDSPRAFIEISGDFYGVSFLDDGGREYLMYTFEEQGPGKLFLKEATHREFEKDSDTVLAGTVYRFWPDGRVVIERSRQPFERVSIEESSTDVSRNWEMKPDFGRYDQLLKKDR